MPYFVRPFTIQNVSSEFIVFVAGGVHSLTSDPMRSLVAELSRNQNAIINDDDLCAAITQRGLGRQVAVDFLTDDVGLLVSSPPLTEVHGDILVVTDLPRLADMLAESLVLPRSCKVLVDDGNEQETIHPACVVLAMGDYRAESVRAMYAEYGAHPGIALITSYLYRHYFVIDGTFLPSRGLPCHFCHRHHFARGESRRWAGGDGGWIDARQHLEQKGVIVPHEVPLTVALEGEIAFSLKHEIESLFAIGNSPRLGETIGTSLQIDLKTGERQRDKVFHWAACDCLKGDWT